MLDPLRFKRKAMVDDPLLSGSARHSSAPSLFSTLTSTADTPVAHSNGALTSLAKQQPKVHHAGSHLHSKLQHSGHIPDLPGLIPSPSLSPVPDHTTKSRAAFLNKDHLSSEVASKSITARQSHNSLSRILPQGTVVQ